MAINRYGAGVWDDTTAGWASDNTVYAHNALLFNVQTGSLKKGNGVNKYADLPAVGGSGGAAIWGDITGTLSNQADLQAALTAKANTADLTAHTGNTGNPHGVTAAQVGLGNVNNTSDANKPVSGATQTALNAKANAADLTAHTANVANPHAVTAAQVGLGNVNNTADTAKPISTATQTALDLKANLASPALSGTPTAPTAAAATNNTQIATTAFVAAAIAGVGAAQLTATSPPLTFGNVAANSFVDLGLDVTGAAYGDVVSVGIPIAAFVDGVTFFAGVSNDSPGVVTIRCANCTATPRTVPEGVYKILVTKI